MNNSTADGTDSSNAPAAARVRFLRSYGPTPDNLNLFDEYVTGALGRANVKPITLTSPQFDEMKRRLSSAER